VRLKRAIVSEFFTWPARAHSMRAAGEWSVVGQRAVNVSEVFVPPLLAAHHKGHQVVDLALQWPVGRAIRAEFRHLRRLELVVLTHGFRPP
jgi:hypothetical protein